MSPLLSLLLVAAVLPCLVLSAPLLSEAEYAAQFDAWARQQGREYSAAAVPARLAAFTANHRVVSEHNERAAAGLLSFTLALNQHADLTNAEYRQQLLGYRRRNDSTHSFRPHSRRMSLLQHATRSSSSAGRRPDWPLPSLPPFVPPFNPPSPPESTAGWGPWTPPGADSSSSVPVVPPAADSSSAVPVPPTPSPDSSSSCTVPVPPTPAASSSSSAAPAPPAPASSAAPSSINATVDWRSSGLINAIKDQGQCGSCWAFSSTASMESAWAQASGVLLSFSEQQLVDCVNGGADTCDTGGDMHDSWQYFLDSSPKPFPETEAAYPYTGQSLGQCQYAAASAQSQVTFKSSADIPQGSESALQAASAVRPAVSVAIDASSQSFQLYSGGVYTDDGCSTTQLDHGVAVVGYGSTGGQDYWIVRNSWGSTWGQAGYILMRRNYNNMCGIATDATYIVA